MNYAIAYLVGIFVAAPLAAAAGTLGAAVVGIIWPKPVLGWLVGYMEALLVGYACRALFEWQDAPFTWYAYLACATPIVLNDARRMALAYQADPSTPRAALEQNTFFGLVLGMAAYLWS